MPERNDFLTGSAWNSVNLLTVPEIAEWARVHPKTVYRWIKDGKIDAIQFGPRTFRIPENTIRHFLITEGYIRKGSIRVAIKREL